MPISATVILWPPLFLPSISPQPPLDLPSTFLDLQVYAVLLLWTRRYRQLCDSGDVPFAMIFKNNGFEAGATQQHPHSQLIGFPVVPAHTKVVPCRLPADCIPIALAAHRRPRWSRPRTSPPRLPFTADLLPSPSHSQEMLNCARTHHEVNGSCCYCAMAKALRSPSRDKQRPSGNELVVYQVSCPPSTFRVLSDTFL